ncbi:hypothetical protein GLOTRDRAFT_123851 [Gloeophyllum trabeum ATCC 11539]|uniref:Uncharacterized protein n=1 Tax=Gloeophyllum trabeum (strain ATCC 11539 / FP-39264 / Madison 617) TaxID=670483 RepID=S7QLA7_GLOTA|nr:uncharacterized protein GLOTRDRAFT_123851 [Gloeophyllum trabeum ATCC 11539]EPQ60092.1 hypothetical protein GLOTRDRAFT_123851 [Gloeophyllum trabeum ATCC 11539]
MVADLSLSTGIRLISTRSRLALKKEKVRDKVVELLDAKKIMITAVDYVRFAWPNKKNGEVKVDEDDSDEDELDYDSIPPIKPVEDGERHYSNPTIGVGVAPNILTAAAAFEATKHIRAYLAEFNVSVIDIAFRETIPKPSVSPALFAPVGIIDYRKEFIDSVSVALSLPIAGRKTTMQGTMGSVPKIQVVLMGKPAFTNYLSSIQARIETSMDTVDACQVKIKALASDRWGKTSRRVIGHVVWAPPIGVGAHPHQYTRDLCVVQLYKESFASLLGNVLSLGPEYTSKKLKSLLHERDDAESAFEYPPDGLFVLQNIPTAQQLSNPHNKNVGGEPLRRAVKHGFATNTSVGTVSRFMSFVRK